MTGSQYVTARTTPSGQVSHGIAVEGGAMINKADGRVFGGAVMGYQLRVGLGDYVDAGLRVSPWPRLDLKVNFFRSDSADIAVDPSSELLYIPVHDASGFLFRAGVPFLVDLNVSERASIVLHIGPQYLGDFEEDEHSIGVNAGVGVQVRITPIFAIQPELSTAFMPSLELLDADTFVAFGVGVLLGPQPSFERKAGAN